MKKILVMLIAGAALLPVAALGRQPGIFGTYSSAMSFARENLTIAQHEAHFAAQAESVESARAHLHRALNCLVGPGDPSFDPQITNHCDGSVSQVLFPLQTDIHLHGRLYPPQLSDAAKADLLNREINASENKSAALTLGQKEKAAQAVALLQHTIVQLRHGLQESDLATAQKDASTAAANFAAALATLSSA